MSYAVPALPRPHVGGRRPTVVAGAAALLVATLAVALPRPAPTGAPARPVATTRHAALPLATRLTISRTVGADLPAYALRASGAGAVGATPAQRLTERFDRSGVTVSAGAHRLGLALRSLAGDGTTVALPRATPSARANRVSYARGPVTEWYDNGPLGLEQSFRIAAAPTAGARTLTLDLALGGTLTARVATSGDGGGLALVDARGTTVLRYRGLVAHDARGRALPARMVRTPDGVALTVRATGARYPVTVDPVVQQGRLTASDGVLGQNFGDPVAISGDTIAVGSQEAAIGGNTQGAVYVFTKPAGGWANGTQVAKLYASDAGIGGNSTSNVYGDTLGSAVAISGDTVVAGAPRATAGGQGYAGKVYVFVRPSGGWAPAAFQTAELAAADATEFDNFGSSVATDGATIVSGAPRAGSLEYGAAYVYTKPPGGWVSATQTARLTASDGGSGLGYAYAVAVAGSTVAVGSPYTGSGLGAVYTYKKPDVGGWGTATQTAKLTSSPQVPNESLGSALAMEGTTLVVGAPNNYNPGSAVPSVYVFEQPAGNWTGTATSSVRLTQSDPTSGNHFGDAVGISGATITAASAYTPGPTSATSGGVYVFTRNGATWASTTVAEKVSAPDGNVEQADSVAIAGTTVVMSAKYAKVGTTNEQGAAYVFDTSGAGPGTGGGGTGGEPTTPPAATEPVPTPAPPASTAVITFVPVVTRVRNDIGWGDVAANLLGITPGSGATSDWGQFVFIALCKQPDGCKGTITFGAQKPAPGATVARAAAKKKTAAPYAKATFSLRADQKRTLTIKLSSTARKLGRKKKKLTGYVTVTIKRPGTTAAVLSHALTLKVAPKKQKAKKK